MNFYEIPWSIISSLCICLICILIFLRFMGKSQASQMTPLDTVNAFVIGAMVSGVVYDTRISVWHFVFAIAVWMALNYAVRLLSRSNFLKNLVFGSEEFLIKNGKVNLALLRKNNMHMEELNAVLRERDIYSISEVKDLIFETDGNFTVTTQKNRQNSFILIDNGSPDEDSLQNSGQTKEWLEAQLKKFNLDPEKIFALSWTPGKCFHIVDNDGNVTYRPEN